MDHKPHHLSQSFIGKQADDLGQLISEQIKPLYVSLGIVVPVKSCSIIHTLSRLGQASVTEIARVLNQSHQLVKQKLPRLIQLALIEDHADPNDKRKTYYALTQLGQDQADLLRQHSLEKVYAQLSDQVGADLYRVLTAAISELKNQDLYSRYLEQQENKQEKIQEN